MIQRTDTLTAPLRDPTEVLIEEVRQQTRRRRRRNIGLAALVLVAGSGSYIAATAGNDSHRPGAGAPPESTMPPAVTSAINKTLAVQSVEVLVSYEPGPGIYQAPDLYYTPLGGGASTPKIGRVTASFIAGGTRYFATSKGTTFRSQISNAGVETSPPLREVKGLSPAQEAAFGIVDFVRSGSDFVSPAVGTYAFRLALVTGPHHADIRYTGGEVTLAHGYVASVRLYAVASEVYFTATPTTASSKTARTTSSRRVAGTIVVQYKRIDHNPRLVAPRPKTVMCLPSGSFVLEKC